MQGRELCLDALQLPLSNLSQLKQYVPALFYNVYSIMLFGFMATFRNNLSDFFGFNKVS
jgi:hypothetical protein